MVRFGIWTKLALGLIFVSVIYLWLTPYFAGRLSPNPIWLHLSSLSLYWYGLLMALAVLVGLGIVLHLNNRFTHLPSDPVFYSIVWSIVGGFIGARLLFVILKWPLYAHNLSEIFQTHSGGMSIHGGIIGGILALWWSSRLFKLNFGKLVDLAAIALPVGQAIGRFGNFFNQEAFGGPTNLPWKMYVAPNFRPAGLQDFSFFHPTFLYEAAGDLLIAGILSWLFLHRRQLTAGSLALWYLVLYSCLRFVMEFFRIDSDRWQFLTVAQWGSLGLIILGVGILLYLHKRHGHS